MILFSCQISAISFYFLRLIMFQLAKLITIQYKALSIYNKMIEEAAKKNEQFRVQIRRKQRDSLFRKEREQLLYEERVANVLMTPTLSPQQLKKITLHEIACRNTRQLYKIFYNNKNTLDVIETESIAEVLGLVLNPEALGSEQGALLLGYLIQQSASLTPKCKILRELLDKARIQEYLYELAVSSAVQGRENMAKLYLFALKNMALVKLQGVRRVDMLQKFLAPLLEKFIKENSLVVLLAYVSQKRKLPAPMLVLICQYSTNQNKLYRLCVSTVLNNSITMEDDPEVIRAVFETVVKKCLALMTKCNNESNRKETKWLLDTIKNCIAEYPEGRAQQLLVRLQKVEFNSFANVMLQIGEMSMRLQIYQLLEVLVDKTLPELKQGFLGQVDSQLVYHILRGVEYPNSTTLRSCLKLITKFLAFDIEMHAYLDQDHEFVRVLGNLVYHKDPYVAQLAEGILRYAEDRQKMQGE